MDKYDLLYVAACLTGMACFFYCIFLLYTFTH